MTYELIQIIFSIYIAIIIGGFVTVIIPRLSQDNNVNIIRTLSTPPSHCPKCKTRLSWYEIIPCGIGYFINKGACSHCKTNISIIYPLYEISVAGFIVYFSIIYGWLGLFISSFVVIAISIIYAKYLFYKKNI